MAAIRSLFLVEDSDEDEFLFRHALASMGREFHICRLENASAAIAALKHLPPFDNTDLYPVPDLIFTDLRMPSADGFELLSWMQHSSDSLPIPIIVLSSSFLPDDVAKAYRLGANAFIVKPMAPKKFAAVLTLLIQFWEQCELPVAFEPIKPPEDWHPTHPGKEIQGDLRIAARELRQHRI